MIYAAFSITLISALLAITALVASIGETNETLSRTRIDTNLDRNI